MSKPIAFVAMAVLIAACAGCQAPTGSGEASSEVVARVGDRTFSLEEVDSKAREADLGPYQALYDARRNAVENLIAEHLMNEEAEARGITRDALIAQEVVAKAAPATDAEIEGFYEANKAAMQGRTLDQVKGQIEAVLMNQNRQRAFESFLSSLKSKTTIRVTLDPPRVPVTVAANDPTKGPAGAPVQILEFSEFQ